MTQLNPIAVDHMPIGCVTLPLKTVVVKKGQILKYFGTGVIVVVLGMGVSRLICQRPAAWLKEWPSTAHLHQHMFRTLARGQASRGEQQEASSDTTSSGWLARRRRDQGRVPHQVPVTQAMTTEARRAPGRRQAGAGLHSVLVSSLVQRGQAQAKVSRKGYRFRRF